MAGRRKKGTRPAPRRFQVGDRVRVKHGTMDTEYADMPLGGWAGMVTEIDRFGLHTVQWSDETLANIHPVYKRRCERDGMMVEEYWLEEADLEPDPGGPLRIEQPKRITPRALSPDDQEDRVRMVFGLTADDRLPKPDDDALATYFDYLSERLRFPFSARHETGTFFQPAPSGRVQVVSLDPEWLWGSENGILCEVRDGDELETLPLAELSVRRSTANYQLVDDYTAWFDGELPWTEEDEDEYDEDEEAEEDGDLFDKAELLEQIRSAPWSRAVLPAITLAVLGGFAGAAIGSAVAAMSWAKWGAAIGAALVGCIAAFTFDRSGERKLAHVAPASLRAFLGCIAGFTGALFGALLGTMVVAFVGALGGWSAGYVIRWPWSRTENPPLFNFLSVLLAVCGVIGQAFYLNPAEAFGGLMLGASGCAAGAVLTVAGVVFFAKVAVPREVPE